MGTAGDAGDVRLDLLLLVLLRLRLLCLRLLLPTPLGLLGALRVLVLVLGSEGFLLQSGLGCGLVSLEVVEEALKGSHLEEVDGVDQFFPGDGQPGQSGVAILLGFQAASLLVQSLEEEVGKDLRPKVGRNGQGIDAGQLT